MTPYGIRLYAALMAARDAKPNKQGLSADEIKTIGEAQVQIFREEWAREATPTKAAPVPRKRNELLDALVKLCGGDPETTTKSEFRTAATALSEIKTVCPDLTIAELEARCATYRQKNRDWALTPPALAKWWSHLGGGPRTKSEKADIYIEPPGWRGVLQTMYQLSNAGIRDKEWLDLGPDTRREILNRMKAV